MTDTPRKIVICSCEDSMSLDPGSIAKGCKNASFTTARHLCRSELPKFRELAQTGRLTVACTQEAPLFREVAEDDGLQAELTFTNIRETAGWSKEGDKSAAKMAALLAASEEEVPPTAAIPLESEGVALIWGEAAAAIEVAELLKDRLDITVVVAGNDDVTPPRRSEYPIRRGRIRTANGHLGTFEITLDGYAEPAASSRAKLAFGRARDGAISKADILIDLSGGAPLFPGHDLRPGYLKADPGDPIGLQKLAFEAADLVGTFDKPRYITFKPDLCVHSRSKITGCRRCLDLCPAGAITPNGNAVAIDPAICGGCGQCAAACPTGAASYALPAADLVVRQVRRMLTAYRAAGGQQPVLLIHDRDHGEALIDVLARFGDGLPANVLPLGVNEVTQVGLEVVAAAFGYGVASVRFLTRARPKHDITGLRQTIAAIGPLLSGLGYGAGLVETIETDDPDALGLALGGVKLATSITKPAGFLPTGAKRDVLKLALRELHRAAPEPVDVIALPAGAVFGRVRVETDGCTLCLACVAACPTGALGDNQEKPQLRFDESLCVQCGLCQGTCPEKVISLEPRLNFAAFEAGPQIVKEEEPFCCTACGKAFGTKSTIERVTAKLEASHWMFKGEGRSRLDLLKMCDTCRIEAVTTQGLDPYAAAARPPAKTTEDYLREREAKVREAEMLDKIEKGEA